MGEAADRIEELERALAEAQADARRFAYWFSNEQKPGKLLTDYLDGVREKWSLDQWRAAIDAAMKEGQ